VTSGQLPQVHLAGHGSQVVLSLRCENDAARMQIHAQAAKGTSLRNGNEPRGRAPDHHDHPGRERSQRSCNQSRLSPLHAPGQDETDGSEDRNSDRWLPACPTQEQSVQPDWQQSETLLPILNSRVGARDTGLTLEAH
jgi:hypothetical protein